MSTNTGDSSGMYHFIKRALEGRVTPLQFLLILGFFSSLMLLYISLHVHFFNMSNEIVMNRERLDVLMDANVRLMAVYNDLSSPGRIIPMAQGLKMRPGSSGEVRRLALRRGAKSGAEEFSWAEAGKTGRFYYSGMTPRVTR